MASVADRVDHRCRVVYDKDDETGQDLSYIFNKASKRIAKMRRDGNVCKVETIVRPSMIMSDRERWISADKGECIALCKARRPLERRRGQVAT